MREESTSGILWMNEIRFSHHLETVGNHEEPVPVGICRGSIIPGFLGGAGFCP